MVTISEVKTGSPRENRTAAHTHIKGLGLRADGTAEKTAAGFVGQESAREVSPHSYPHLPPQLLTKPIVTDRHAESSST